MKQSVALVQTARPVMESHAVVVTERHPSLASIYDTAHDLWPLLPGFKPAEWRVQGMAAHRLTGGIIQTMTALGAWLATLIDPFVGNILFALFVVFIAVQMALKALRSGRGTARG